MTGISRCAEKSEHMAATGVIWPRFFHPDGCQTKATCVTGLRGAQSTPGRSINTMCATPHQFGGRGSLGSQCAHTASIIRCRERASRLTSCHQLLFLLPEALMFGVCKAHVVCYSLIIAIAIPFQVNVPLLSVHLCDSTLVYARTVLLCHYL